MAKTELINHLLSAGNFTVNTDYLSSLINRLNIEPSYPIVLIGGTNGKGSTCAYLTTILTNAGYKVGTFTSPHIFEYNERIQINNKTIDDATLSNALEQIITASTDNIGMFNAFTLASHIIFCQHKIDIAIVEVGLGGRCDPTNLFDPDISAITGVDLDHCAILGDTLDKIGLEKAHIYRSNKPALFGSKNTPDSVKKYASSICAEFKQIDEQFGYRTHDHSWDFYSPKLNLYSLPFPSMRGKEQLANASLALAIMAELREKFPVNSSQIKNSLLQTSLVGRFQVLPGTPQIVFDTAHNPQALEAMWNNVLKLHFAKRNFAVFAIANDKDWQKIIAIHARHFDEWFISDLNTTRSADKSDIQQALLNHKVPACNIHLYESLEDATISAYNNLSTEDRMVCFGSFITVEHSYKAIKKVRK